MATQLRNPNARFVLDHVAKKSPCPSCGKRGTFRLYTDRHTGEHLPEHCGVCDRENNCGYTYTAAQWLRDGGVVPDIEKFRMPTPPPPRNDWRCPEEWVERTLCSSMHNNLANWLRPILPLIPTVFGDYGVGTYPMGKNYPQLHGAMVFWQMGQDIRPRSGKVIQYDPETGKRRKDVQPNWMHTIITKQSMEDLGCAQCFFGEHLLHRHPDTPVAIVESEKTALICACLYPEWIWLATGGAHMLNTSKAMVLAGRDVTFFPDQGQLENWTARAMDIEPMLGRCYISDIMECIGAAEGEDIADYLVPINVIHQMDIDIFPQQQYVLREENHVLFTNEHVEESNAHREEFMTMVQRDGAPPGGDTVVWTKIPESTGPPMSKEEYWAKFVNFYKDQVRVPQPPPLFLDASDPRWVQEADIKEFLTDAAPPDPEFEAETREWIPPVVFPQSPLDRIKALPGMQALEKEIPIDWARAHIKPIEP